MTGAGMGDCKKALKEAEGDFDKAIEVLRKKGQKIMAKRADRTATEGAVIAKAEGGKGIVVNLTSETDFVSKNADFIAIANRIGDIALANFPASLEELNALPYDDKLTVGQKTLEQAGVIGEKIEVGKYETLEGDTVVAYIHGGNRMGVLVGLNQVGELETVGKNVAMQIAAMNPIAIDKSDVPEAEIAKELEIQTEIAHKERPDKPAAMLEKIAMGKVNKLFFKAKTLLNQTYVKDSKSNVGKYSYEIVI